MSVWGAGMPDQARETPAIASETESIETKPELWLDRYGDVLFRDAMVRLGDRAAASDAVQETFLAALRNVRDGRFDGRVEFRAWLRAILRNKAVDQIRRRVRERPFDTSDPEGIGETLLYRWTGLPTTTPENWAFDLETAFEREEFWGAFEACMSGLGDLQRSVFTMKVIDGVSTDEICNILGVNANNMGVLLHRGRQALKCCLENKWFVED
jgi:RNA polymerase sigma-70 factor (ECF subfamily)